MPAATDLKHAASARAARQRGRAGARPVAIVDIGSNSVRLVIYENQTRNAATLQNEKAICGIGRDMVSTGRLHAEGCAAALEALARFRMIADGLGVGSARSGGDGGGARRRPMARNSCAAPNAPGARRSACWRARTKRASPPKAWWRAFPRPTGLVADLGGGSLDMVTVKGGKTGEALTLPFGPLRLMDQAKGDPDKARDMVDKGLKEYFRPVGAPALYAVGGIWRSFARVDMEEHHYPLHVLQQYTIPRGRALAAVQGAGAACRGNRCARSRSCPSAAPRRCPMARWCWSGCCWRATSRMW